MYRGIPPFENLFWKHNRILKKNKIQFYKVGVWFTPFLTIKVWLFRYAPILMIPEKPEMNKGEDLKCSKDSEPNRRTKMNLLQKAIQLRKTNFFEQSIMNSYGGNNFLNPIRTLTQLTF